MAVGNPVAGAASVQVPSAAVDAPHRQALGEVTALVGVQDRGIKLYGHINSSLQPKGLGHHFDFRAYF